VEVGVKEYDAWVMAVKKMGSQCSVDAIHYMIKEISHRKKKRNIPPPEEGLMVKPCKKPLLLYSKSIKKNLFPKIIPKIIA
jgi:hypothetical protein